MALAALVVMVALATSATAAEPSLALSSPRVAPGQVVHASAENLLPGVRCGIHLLVGGRKILLADVHADAQGRLEVDLEIPSDLAPGQYEVELTTQDGTVLTQPLEVGQPVPESVPPAGTSQPTAEATAGSESPRPSPQREAGTPQPTAEATAAGGAESPGSSPPQKIDEGSRGIETGIVLGGGVAIAVGVAALYVLSRSSNRRRSEPKGPEIPGKPRKPRPGDKVKILPGKPSSSYTLVYRYPSFEEAILKLGAGEEVTVLGEQPGWYKVDYKGSVGYVSRDVLSAPGPRPELAEEPDRSGPRETDHETAARG
jgi:hypothetical protein